jgi:hypothetical protein
MIAPHLGWITAVTCCKRHICGGLKQNESITKAKATLKCAFGLVKKILSPSGSSISTAVNGKSALKASAEGSGIMIVDARWLGAAALALAIRAWTCSLGRTRKERMSAGQSKWRGWISGFGDRRRMWLVAT